MNLHEQNLPFKDHKVLIPQHSMSNEQMGAVTREPLKKDTSQTSLQAAQYQTFIPIDTDKKRDSFYHRGGTYNSIFKDETAKIDSKGRAASITEYQKSKKLNKEHHKTALLGHDYRDIYNRTDGSNGGVNYPQYNVSVPVKMDERGKEAYMTHKNEMLNNM